MHVDGLCLCSAWVYTALSPSFTLVMKYKHTFFTVREREREKMRVVWKSRSGSHAVYIWVCLIGEISLVICLLEQSDFEHQARVTLHVRELKFETLGSKYAGMPFITGLPSCWPKRYLIPHFLQPNERKKGGRRKRAMEKCVCMCVCVW